jgi:CDP-6-deoxy-D-xylo-4-hexulose-3-dehydrase
VVSELVNTDIITSNTFFVGVYPGITAGQIEHMLSSFATFLRGR